MNKILKGDMIQVIAGNDKGKKGEVHRVIPADKTVLVSGINLIKKHQKRTSADVKTQAGIIEREDVINISKVALICKNCGKPTRVGFKTFEDGHKSRQCKKCGEVIE